MTTTSSSQIDQLNQRWRRFLPHLVDKRQNHYLDEIFQTQHKMTQEIHKMLTEEIRLINEMRKE